jgi:hypothetical protein
MSHDMDVPGFLRHLEQCKAGGFGFVLRFAIGLPLAWSSYAGPLAVHLDGERQRWVSAGVVSEQPPPSTSPSKCGLEAWLSRLSRSRRRESRANQTTRHSAALPLAGHALFVHGDLNRCPRLDAGGPLGLHNHRPVQRVRWD